MPTTIIWDLGGTLITPPPGGQDRAPLDTYPEISLRPGALGVLDHLADQAYRQAVLSNTAVSDEQVVGRLLKRLGVLDYFAVIVATRSELDSARPGKPASVVFERVLQATGTMRSQAVMVGNSWDHDVVGANRAGLDAIWLTNPAVAVRTAAEPLNQPPWIVEVFDLDQVPAALAELKARRSRGGRA